MQEQIQSLKDNELTQVLADGFALLYHRKPKFPITYLANYLKNYQHAQNEKKKISEKISNNKKIVDEMVKKEGEIGVLQKVEEEKRAKYDEQEKQFLNTISQTQYHEDILDYFCNWIEKRFKLTGVYMGELKNVKKNVNLADEDSQEAHFDAQAPKLIYFEHSSATHKNIVLGKTLTQESVLGKLLTGNAGGQAENQDQPADGQGGEVKQIKPKDQIYFPTVVDNKQLHFFKFPRLGSFFGIGTKINSYLSNKLFDQNAQKVQVFHKQLQEYEKLREQRESKFKQVYDQKVNSGTQEHELQAMEKQFEKQQAQFVKPQLKQFDSIKRQFVLGFDTLGQDRQISKQEQVKIKQYVNFLKKCWENRELQGLKTDINRHLKLQDKIQVPHQQTFVKIITDDDREIASHQQVQKYKDNEKLMELQMDTLRVQKLKEHLSDEKYEPFLEEILKAKVLKYSQILKYWLIFTGKKKEQITIPGTNLLDYRNTKQFLSKEEFLKHINEYTLRGSKPQVLVPNYAKWQRQERNFQKLDPQNVAAYNIYLAFILRYLQLAAKVRKADRAKRVHIMRQERKARVEKRAENERKIKQKEQKLEAAKAEAAEKQEEFDQEAWQHHYNEAEQNHPAEIGPEIADEIDRDLQNGEELFPEEDIPVQNGENVPPPAQ